MLYLYKAWFISRIAWRGCLVMVAVGMWAFTGTRNQEIKLGVLHNPTAYIQCSRNGHSALILSSHWNARDKHIKCGVNVCRTCNCVYTTAHTCQAIKSISWSFDTWPLVFAGKREYYLFLWEDRVELKSAFTISFLCWGLNLNSAMMGMWLGKRESECVC